MAKKIIFSGIQPTGNLHLGNYLGAVRNIVELQNTGDYQMYYFIADYHSLTGNMSPKDRREQVRITAAELIAAGIDPEKTVLFVQSQVPEHLELAWIFNCLTPVTELERMTQFKDKSDSQKKNINAGLFTYPCLQAADILLYHGSIVPVGIDQKQHVELTRNIARWFNKKYGKYFTEPEVLLTKTAKVMSLLEPDKKMSKSKGAGHVIELCEGQDEITKKLKKAVTASAGGRKAPGVTNLLMLLEMFGDSKVFTEYKIAEKKGDIRYGDLKQTLADAIATYFVDFRKKRSELLNDKKGITKILETGAVSAKQVATGTIIKVRDLVGIR
jgi:tryptophanyl-tRNA synthetase